MRLLRNTSDIAALSIAAPAYYLLALTALSTSARHHPRSVALKFAVVVPAHNEASTISSTIASLHSISYSSDLFRIIVIADNCTDNTAVVAQQLGAIVMTRTDGHDVGKGHALHWAFQRVLDDAWVEAIVVIDADTVVAPDLLHVIGGQLAAGEPAVQVDYRVRNPGESWRTRLVDVAFTCKNRIRPAGRSRAGGSAGLSGNGMAFTRATLERVPYQAFSAVEDLEYGILLARAGIAVAFTDDTFVAGDMPSDANGATAQRIRWELGRDEIRRRQGIGLARDALTSGDPLLADIAADLYAPPLATIITRLTMATVVAAACRPLVGRRPLALLTVGWCGMVAHVVLGMARSQSRWSAVTAMLRVPTYVVWKVSVRASSAWKSQRNDRTDWSRTQRSASLQSLDAQSSDTQE